MQLPCAVNKTLQDMRKLDSYLERYTMQNIHIHLSDSIAKLKRMPAVAGISFLLTESEDNRGMRMIGNKDKA